MILCSYLSIFALFDIILCLNSSITVLTPLLLTLCFFFQVFQFSVLLLPSSPFPSLSNRFKSCLSLLKPPCILRFHLGSLKNLCKWSLYTTSASSLCFQSETLQHVVPSCKSYLQDARSYLQVSILVDISTTIWTAQFTCQDSSSSPGLNEQN